MFHNKTLTNNPDKCETLILIYLKNKKIMKNKNYSMKIILCLKMKQITVKTVILFQKEKKEAGLNTPFLNWEYLIFL